MITVYSAGTPNGIKITIALEEMNLPYELKKIDLSKNEQKEAQFLKLNPNGKIPVIHDSDNDLTLSESIVILEYLAQKSGQFLPKSQEEHFKLKEMLAFQAAHVGPMLGQYAHFTLFAPEKIEYGIRRYEDESQRILKILDDQLSQFEFLMGTYGIADMANCPWVVTARDHYKMDFSDFDNLNRWCEACMARPAFMKGVQVLL